MMKVTPSNFVGGNYVFLRFKLRPDYSPVFLYRHCFEKSGTYAVLTRSQHIRAKFNGDNPPDRPPRSPAHHAEDRNHRVRLAVDRSRLFVSAALRLAGTRLHSAALTDSPLLSRSCPVDTMTPLAYRDTLAPAAAPARSSHHAPHRVRRC